MRLVPVLPALAALLCAAPPAPAATCDVNPHDAYVLAEQRGWQFLCTAFSRYPGALGAATVLREPPDRVGCQWRTLVPVPDAPRGTLRFFSRTDIASQGNGDLRNGWRIASYEVTGGPYSPEQPANSRLHFTVLLSQANTVIRRRISRLTLHHPTESCANVLDRAF